jgi:hypothetical protein
MTVPNPRGSESSRRASRLFPVFMTRRRQSSSKIHPSVARRPLSFSGSVGTRLGDGKGIFTRRSLVADSPGFPSTGLRQRVSRHSETGLRAPGQNGFVIPGTVRWPPANARRFPEAGTPFPSRLTSRPERLRARFATAGSPVGANPHGQVIANFPACSKTR